jgi:spastin
VISNGFLSKIFCLILYYKYNIFLSETRDYSGSDLTALAKDAAMGPVRELRIDELKKLSVSRIRPISREDFVQALRKIRPSVTPSTLDKYIQWNRSFGDCSS